MVTSSENESGAKGGGEGGGAGGGEGGGGDGGEGGDGGGGGGGNMQMHCLFEAHEPVLPAPQTERELYRPG